MKLKVKKKKKNSVDETIPKTYEPKWYVSEYYNKLNIIE